MNTNLANLQTALRAQPSVAKQIAELPEKAAQEFIQTVAAEYRKGMAGIQKQGLTAQVTVKMLMLNGQMLDVSQMRALSHGIIKIAGMLNGGHAEVLASIHSAQFLLLQETPPPDEPAREIGFHWDDTRP